MEIQTTRDAHLPERIYVYNYRVFDRYNRPVASFVVLADDDPNWRPSEFRQSVLGCETGIRFKPVKLMDFVAHEAMLEASTNPFAKVVLAHLKTQQTRDNPADRHTRKIRLVRSLYDQGFGAKDVRELFRIIDWMMELPPPLKSIFWQEVQTIQMEKHMPFISTPQYVGKLEGLCEGIKVALMLRFGDEGLKLMPEVQNICEVERLQAILKALGASANLKEVRQLCITPAS